MPVEIKELVIKAEFGHPQEEATASVEPVDTTVRQEELIEECVRQVLEILERKRER
ncbi:MAG: hypothetical protein JSW48_01975 [Betaproteobacteria bacterium]|nr:MAG: hypothetical protein JSW48_01975 [Betaproteobacteria bacterium]